MRVWLVDEFGHGGIGRYAVDVANLLGPEMDPFVATSALGPVPGLAGPSVEWFPRGSGSTLAKGWGGLVGIARAVRDVSSGDVAWVPLGIRPLFEAALVSALRARRATVAVTVHNRGPHGRGASRTVLTTARRAHAVVVHTDALHEWASGHGLRAVRLPFPPPQLDTRGDAVHTRDSLGIPPGVSVIGLLGYLYPYKGVDLLLQALADVRRRAPRTPVHVLLAGRVTADFDVEQMIRDLRLTDVVTLRAGWLEEDELSDLLSVADIVALPYRDIDNTGIGAVALSRGLPAVASDLPPLRELFGDAAVYAPAGDVEALSRVLEQIPERLDALKAHVDRRQQTELSTPYRAFVASLAG